MVPETRDESYSSPGRFFAVNEMKLMLAFTMLRYDVMAKDGKRPEDITICGGSHS